jgi:pimeloyl-ACP methyl ester carboxylesterase
MRRSLTELFKLRRVATRLAKAAFLALAVSSLLASCQFTAHAEDTERNVERPTLYRTVKIDGVSIFYREAGAKDAPTLLLLHGFPSSSRMYEPLLARLADRYHLVAPDYPGFGHSDWPDPKAFAYTFDNLAEIMDRFTEALELSRYTPYMQDCGGPVGFRMALAHPERIESLIVQNAVAHNTGLGATLWKPRRAFWADRAANEGALRANFLSLSTARGRHVGSDPDVDRYNPDLWTDEFAFLSRPRASGHPDRPLLRLSRQCRRLSEKAVLAAREAAAASCAVGQIRSFLRHLGAGSLSRGRPDGGGTCPRRRPLRARHQGRRDRAAHPRLHELAAGALDRS